MITTKAEPPALYAPTPSPNVSDAMQAITVSNVQADSTSAEEVLPVQPVIPNASYVLVLVPTAQFVLEDTT